MTKPLYLNDTYSFKSNASIIDTGKDDKGLYVLLDQTIFYPQGGGQPSDQGILQGHDFEINIVMVRQIESEIRHYIGTNDSSHLKNQKITCLIDKDRRLLNARYHTASHLLSNIVESLHPNIKTIKGHSFPNEASIEFQGIDVPDATKLKYELEKAINKGLKTRIFESNQESFEQEFYKLPYPIPGNKAFRIMQIDGFLPIPCGGTHLSTIDEIGNVLITKIKAKNDIIRISYEVI